MEQTQTSKPCPTKNCTGTIKNPKHTACFKCNQQAEKINLLKKIGVADAEASKLASGTSTLCMTCKKHMGISVTINNIPTAMCVTCLVHTVAGTKPVTEESPYKTCKTCKEWFTPTYPAQVYCPRCTERFNASKPVETFPPRKCMTMGCGVEFIPERKTLNFCNPCRSKFNTNK